MRARKEAWPFVPEVRLFHDRAKADRFIRKRFDAVPRFFDTGAQTFYRDCCAVILMEYEGEPMRELALLAHEAYHATMMHFDMLGEEHPSEEFVAYGVQTIAEALFEAHERHKDGRGARVD